MAMQTAGSSPAHSAEFVGNAFVEQYYKVLLSDPDLVYKFYEDSSVLSRPDPNGVMTSVTTMQRIKDNILSLDYKGYKAEITTVDAQDSFKEGVIVLVTGCLTGKDSVRRNFTQTFFLARHAKGYYVLNDVFRYVDVLEALSPSAVNDANEDVPGSPLTPDRESVHVPNQPGQNHISPSKVASNGSEVCDSLDMKGLVDSNCSVVKEAVVNEQPSTLNQNDEHKVAELASNDQEEPQKMSYASIVVKESTVASPVQISTDNIVTVAPSSIHQEQWTSAAPKASALHINSAPQNSNIRPEVKCIFIGNLPSEVSFKELDAIFKKFGPIKKEGIQIRNCKDGFCYGFVEFESSRSARSAIEAHNIVIGSNEAYITEKRSNNQANNSRGRFPSGRGEFRNDNSIEGRSYGRFQYGNRGEFSGKTRGPTGRIEEAHWRVYKNGGGRAAPSSGMK